MLPSYDAEVDRIGQFASCLGVQHFNLIAHDYGGHLALGFVIRHAERVLRLAILNSRAHGTFRPAFYAFSLRQHWFARQRITRTVGGWLPIGTAHRLAFRRYVELGCFSPDLLEEYVGWMDSRHGREWYFHFFTQYHVPVRPELGPGLPGIRCPTAVVWGDRDPYIPLQTAHELAAWIPGATLSVLDGADHFVMEERPGEVSIELQRLLARLALVR